MQLIEGGFALAMATNNGQSCSEAVSAILTAEIQGRVSTNCIKLFQHLEKF